MLWVGLFTIIVAFPGHTHLFKSIINLFFNVSGHSLKCNANMYVTQKTPTAHILWNIENIFFCLHAVDWTYLL